MSRWLTAVVLLLLTGCASTSLFNPYPNQAAAYRAAITNGSIDDTTAALASLKKGKDGLLYAQESGRLHQLNRQFAASREDFDEVYRRYRALDDEARIRLADMGAGAGSLLSNDNAIPYQGYAYERIMALHFQALNYLALGDVEGARVELRRAALEQRSQELAHQQAISDAENAARDNGIALDSWRNSPELAGMELLAGQVKSSFQNAYTFYTSALVHEAAGDRNAALVDYKKALEINPDNAGIREDVRRLDAGQAIGDADSGHLVVLLEDGFVAYKQSFDLALPYFASRGGQQHVTYFTVAFPYYAASVPLSQPLRVASDSQGELGQTAIIANINAMAARALKEQIPLMIVRMVLRARAKHELHQQSAEQGGILGSLLATVYNVVSEQADRRSWLTLPATVQLLRAPLPAGRQTVELMQGAVSRTVDVAIRPGRVTLLRAVNANGRLIVQTFEL